MTILTVPAALAITTENNGEFTARILVDYIGPQSTIIKSKSAAINAKILNCISISQDSKQERTIEYVLGQGAHEEVVRKRNLLCPNSEFIIPEATSSLYSIK